jgi:hypothetical protein
VISPTQRPLPDNTQHSQETNIHAPAECEPAIPARQQPKTHAFDRADTGTGIIIIINKTKQNKTKQQQQQQQQQQRLQSQATLF